MLEIQADEESMFIDQLRLLYDHMVQGALLINTEGIILTANPAAEGILGLSQSAIIGRTIFDPRWKSINQDGTPLLGHKHPVFEALNKNEPVESVFAVFNPQKSTHVWLNFSSVPIKNSIHSKSTCIVATFNDASESIQTFNRLKSSEASYLTLLAKFNHGIAVHNIILDSSKNPVDYSFVYMNPMFEKITGLSMIDTAGKKASEVLKTKELPGLTALAKVALTGDTDIVEYFDNRLNKNFKIIIYCPQIGQFVVVLEDLTEYKKTELDLVHANQRIEELTTLTGTVNNMLSHEIRTPMNGLMGMLQLLEETPLTEEQKKYVEISRNASNALLSELDEILDYNKIKIGELQIRNASFNIHTILNDIKHIYAIQINDKHLEFKFTIDPEVADQLWGDEFRIRQVFSNLISNSIFYTNKGTISVSIKKGPKSNHKCIELICMVEDSGKGMTPEQIQSIFDEKEHAVSQYTRKTEGIGLGLIITKKLVELMKGELWIESVLDQGTTFYFTCLLAHRDSEMEITETVSSINDSSNTSSEMDLIDSINIAEILGTGVDFDNIEFEDVFDLDEIQKIQDAFALAMGVASIITKVDGTPITQPSNFTCLCNDIIRGTELGYKNCMISDSVIGNSKSVGPRVQKCLSAGLLDGGTSIYLGDRHIANWLIGQVIDEDSNIDSLKSYAKQIGVDEAVYVEALNKVIRMPRQQFYNISQYLYLEANLLSKLGLKNVLQTKEIQRRKKMEEELNKINMHLEDLVAERTIRLNEINHELEELNAILEEEIDEKQKVEDAIRQMNSELESKVSERTKELQEMNATLEEEIMERNQSDLKNEYLSYHDVLTGLYNRRYFEEELIGFDIEKNLPISILVGDVNGLKLVNDAFGHDRGDELLKKAAAAILSCTREADLVARWGGDEFIVFLPKTSSAEVDGIVSKMKESYGKEQIESLPLSISFGWETKTDALEDIMKVLKTAEDYMYKHKVMDNQSRLSNTINTIINTLHEKNPREEKHSQRVSFISQKIGQSIGMSKNDIEKLKTIGLLHDIGKIAIDESILNKPGRLDEYEYEQIKRHPDIGYRILTSSPDMEEIAGYIIAHHERYDGKGYPKGLKGESIPLMSRIITIADAYDAMISERPYKTPLTQEEAGLQFQMHAGTQFDPGLAKVFVEQILGYEWNLCERI